MATHNIAKETSKQYDPELQTSRDTSSSQSPSQSRKAAILLTLCIANILQALETTVLSTALPVISTELHAGEDYVWFSNAYLLTLTAFTPIYGQLAIISGRRWPMILTVAAFVLGSGICGGAKTTVTLIAGRAVQGFGAAGISPMSSIIISDLFPERERAKYLGLLFLVYGVGIALGPVVGGLLTGSGNWRWIFWLNLPVGGLAMVLLFLTLQSPALETTSSSPKKKMKQIDWIGNSLLISSVIAILIALSWADIRFPWSSWKVLTPLTLGFAGLAVFHIFEATRFCINPVIPPFIFRTRTSATALLNAFLTTWRIYFLPLYFQGVLFASPGRSGVLLLPTVLIGVPTAALAGFALSRWGRYKPIHLLGNALMTLATGLYINLDHHSSLAKIIVYQILAGVGGGMLLTTTLPAVQVALPPHEVESATATWAYVRAFGAVWGVAVPAVVFNSVFAGKTEQLSQETPDLPTMRDPYALASGSFMRSLRESSQQKIMAVFEETMKITWEVCLGFCVLALFFTLFEEELELKTTALPVDEPRSKEAENRS